MTDKLPSDESAIDKAAVTLPGKVEKIIKPLTPDTPEKAQIHVEGAEELYREIRIDNVLQNADGEEVSLKRGAEVEITVAADPEATTKKPDQPAAQPIEQKTSDNNGHAA